MGPPGMSPVQTRDDRLWPQSAFDRIAFLLQALADAIAEVALQLDAVLDRRATGAAGALQVLRQLLEEALVAGEPVHDRHRFSPAALLLHPQLRDDARRHRFVGADAAA